jgi:hypothetical protein
MSLKLPEVFGSSIDETAQRNNLVSGVSHPLDVACQTSVEPPRPRGHSHPRLTFESAEITVLRPKTGPDHVFVLQKTWSGPVFGFCIR